MDPIKIDDFDCYQYARSRGYEPLTDSRFSMDIHTRISIQNRLFGKGHSPESNERFYRHCWTIYPQVCAECMKPLRSYSAIYVSHILTRGAHPDMAHDCRNVNLLCFEHHNQWENGDRKRMRIYPGNVRIIRQLLDEYNIERYGRSNQ